VINTSARRPIRPRGVYSLRGASVAGKIDALLKVCVVLSVLLVSSSVGYYYLVYLPARDAQIDFERVLESARIDAAKRAEQERALLQQQAIEQRVSAEKAATQFRYDACLSSAGRQYDASWM
jgi:hypothetical protein